MRSTYMHTFSWEALTHTRARARTHTHTHAHTHTQEHLHGQQLAACNLQIPELTQSARKLMRWHLKRVAHLGVLHTGE